MRRFILILIGLIFLSGMLHAQDFLTIGGGFSLAFYNAKNLDHFTQSYNDVNRLSLGQYCEGIGGGEGIRWEIGYRRFGRFTAAILGGSQSYMRHDFATFGNGEERGLELKVQSLYVEGQFGRSFKSIFVNGCIALYFNRKVSIDSRYSGAAGTDVVKSLSGYYENDATFSTDLGIAFGVYKKPIFLVLKVSYPVFTGGSKKVLRDRRVEKRETGTDVFPRDYWDFLELGDYEGISSNIDGFKLSLTFAFALRFHQ